MVRQHSGFFCALAVLASVAGFAVGCGGASGNFSGKKSIAGNATAQGAFNVVGSLATGRASHTATLMTAGPFAGDVLVVGGRGRSGSSDAVLDSAEAFHPSAGSWRVCLGTVNAGGQPGLRGRMCHGAAALATGEVLIAGGQADAAGANTLASCEVFDPAQDQFLPVSGALTNPKSDPAMLAYDRQGVTMVLIAGGRSTATQAVRSANVFQGDVKQITAASPTMPTGGFGAKALALSSGKVLIAGGQDSGTAQGSEVFDPAQSTFAAGASLVRNRAGMGAALLGGAPAVFGGMSGATVLDTIEIYDEARGVWTQAKATLGTARAGCTATTLSSGDVLVIGGTDASGRALNSTEIVIGMGAGAVVIPGPSAQFPRSGHTATLVKLGGADAILVAGGVDAGGVPMAACEVFALPGTIVPSGLTASGVGAVPTIAGLSPIGGAPGTRVTISGTGFSSTPNQNVVRFNGIAAPVAGSAPGQLSVGCPNGATSGSVTVQVGTQTSNGVNFDVLQTTAGGAGTSPFTGPPNILVVLPNPTFAIPIIGSVVLVGGSNFDQSAVPYFGTTPSVQLYNFGVQNIPFVGSVAAGFTVVPPSISAGTTTNVSVQEYGLMSNFVPLQVQ